VIFTGSGRLPLGVGPQAYKSPEVEIAIEKSDAAIVFIGGKSFNFVKAFTLCISSNPSSQFWFLPVE